jgi:hypothetical protein
MAYAIMRWSRIQTATQAAVATAHSYRHADEAHDVSRTASHPNLEFVNVGERDYWDLATERIVAVGIQRQRMGTTRCLEAIITASSEWFERGSDGQITDYSRSAWLRDTRTFLIEKFGGQNLVAFQIRQSGTSPLVHAVIVPITPDGRLSAREVLNPVTLRGYQKEYTEMMKAHGLGHDIL